jgi:hypothetical protein
MKRNPRLILNADETHVSTNKSFKVLHQEGTLPLRSATGSMPHFSAMMAISAMGYRFSPTFILPQSHALPNDLDCYRERAYFISSETGWMNQRCFLLWARFFLAELSIYKQTLPRELWQHKFLLILDGHSSRWTLEAMALFQANNVDVLIMPSHCTHLLQPFDVALAGPLKSFMRAELDKQTFTITHDQFHEMITEKIEPRILSQKRGLIIEAFLTAWEKAATTHNIAAGFEAAGIYPLNVERAVHNHYVNRTIPDREDTRSSGRLATSGGIG